MVHARDLGRRVFELYWKQARPFSEQGPLRQSGQRDLVVKIAELRGGLGLAEHAPIDDARRRHPLELRRLEREAVATVVRYRGSPGPSSNGWLRYVARRNSDHVDELRLESFLFGSQRISLAPVRDPLLQLQGGACFYCRRGGGTWEVDHFLPWARWPDDRLDNLVVAHRRCNNDKRASLAGLGHLARWRARSAPGARDDRRLADLARGTSWPRDPAGTASGGRGLYLHQPAGTMLWAGLGSVEPLEPRRLAAILGTPAEVAAEGRGTYRDP